MSKKTNTVSQESYKASASEAAKVVNGAHLKLSEIGRNLTHSHDFSPVTIKGMREALADIDTLRATLKGMIDVSVARGCTHFDEEKQKLVEGTLKLNRRDNVLDQAAE